MAVFNLIAALGALVLCFGGWSARGYLDSHPGVHLTVPAPVRWVLPAKWKRLDVTTLADQRDAALREAAGAKRCQADLASLRSATTAQNAAVAALGHESEARIAKSAKAASAARAVAESYRVQAQAILDARAESPDACVAADLLILKEAGR